MKRWLAAVLFGAVLAANAGEVVFIPGWNTEYTPEETYAAPLREIYPDDRITVLKWRSVTGISFYKGIVNAEAFAPEAVKYIAAKSPEARAELTLIGHSLGGRIAVDVAAQLARNNIKVKRIVLLGAAVDCDVDLAPVAAASTAPAVNVFSTRDFALKHAYPKNRHASPLGFCGAAAPPAEGFVEYCVTPPASAGKPEVYIRVVNGLQTHDAAVYLNELHHILKGERTPYRARYDYSRVEKYLKDNTTGWTPPKHWGVPLESGIECYELVRPFLPAFLRNAAEPGKPVTLDSYAGWRFLKMPVTFRRPNRFKVPVKYTKYIYFIVDHYERIRQCGISYTEMKNNFAAIKSLIVENR